MLDWKRCGKQRVEARQIYNILTNGTSKTGWRNHPAVKMWRGYEDALAWYHNTMIVEWIARGYKNTMPLIDIDWDALRLPPFVGVHRFHASHRSNLLRKDYEYYSRFGWDEPADLPYVWGL